MFVNCDVVIKNNIIIPANIDLVFGSKGVFRFDRKSKLIIYGSISAGNYLIFDLNNGGVIAGVPRSSFIKPEWFGAIGNGIHNDTRAINITVRLSKKIKLSGIYFVDSVPMFNHHIIEGEGKFVIKAGLYNVKNTISVDWADRISFLGSSSKLIYKSIRKISGSKGDWNICFELNKVDNVLPGYFLQIIGSKGDGVTKVIEGVWEITSVKNNIVTVRNTLQVDNFPDFKLKHCRIKLIKTVIMADRKTVFQLYGGNFTSNKIVYKVSNAVINDGTKAFSVAPRKTHTDHNINNASALFKSETGFVGAGNHGLVVGGSSWVECEPTVSACGNNLDGFHATEGASGFFKFCIANGNRRAGIMSEMNSYMDAAGIICCGNKLHGAVAVSGKINISNPKTTLAYNRYNGALSKNGGNIYAVGAKSIFNDIGMKATKFSTIIARSSIVEYNRIGLLSSCFSYIDANNINLLNNKRKIEFSDKSLITIKSVY
ncbi:MAG: hypothetical protein GY756_13950 [bacterium]|nr:hypothetical protein [bacterium]